MEIPHAKWSRNTYREDGKQSACNHETLAVREENVMVARVTLHNMKQDRSESIHYFGARFQGQAGVCRFTQQPTAMLMWTILKPYYEMYYVKDWNIQRYNLTYWAIR